MTQGLPAESPCFSCSVYGIVGITDSSVEELAKHCNGTLHTLDVNGCVNVKVRLLKIGTVHNEMSNRFTTPGLEADASRLASVIVPWSLWGGETCDPGSASRFETCAG
jgi:hypothetical protein